MNFEKYSILYKGGIGEVEEKKSRFIATASPVDSEEEALKFIEEMKKKYWDARHNCFAYTIGSQNEVMRCSDDGEPSQTAGKPILDVIVKSGIHNAAVVVTRYFGGVLLGTGGLVRAYSKAAQEGLAAGVVVEKIPARVFTLGTDYNSIGKLNYIAGSMDLHIIDTRYTDAVEMEIVVDLNKADIFKNKITEATGAKCGITEGEVCHYAVVDGKTVVFN